MAQRAEIRIQIPCSGGFPTEAEMELRDAVEDAIEVRGIGEIVDAGSGMGAMDLAIAVTKPKAALREITSLIEEVAPGSRATCQLVLPKKEPLPSVPFQPGDCLAVRLEDGDYGAALALARTDDPRLGTNILVCTLRYKAPAVPGREVFERREWLALNHHAWKGKRDIYWCMAFDFAENVSRFEAVARVPLLPSDPLTSRTLGGWRLLGRQTLAQAIWDAGVRE